MTTHALTPPAATTAGRDRARPGCGPDRAAMRCLQPPPHTPAWSRPATPAATRNSDTASPPPRQTWWPPTPMPRCHYDIGAVPAKHSTIANSDPVQRSHQRLIDAVEPFCRVDGPARRTRILCCHRVQPTHHLQQARRSSTRSGCAGITDLSRLRAAVHRIGFLDTGTQSPVAAAARSAVAGVSIRKSLATVPSPTSTPPRCCHWLRT